MLSVTHKTILYLIEILQEVYYPDFAQQLNQLLKTNFPFDPENPEQYQGFLKNCLNRSKGLKIDFDLKTIRFQAIKEKMNSRGGEKVTRQYFQSILITISDFVQYPVTDNITVFEYCDRIRRLNEYREKQKAK